MKILYAIIIILAVYAIGTFIRLRYTLSVANLPNIVQQDKTFANQQSVAGESKTVRYIAAGDSTAAGEGASSVEKTYTYRVAELLSQTNTVEYRNVGVRGAQTQDVLDDQLEKIIAFNPDVVTLSIGANDVTHLKSSKKVVANFKTIIETLQTKTSAQIYITDVPILDQVTLLPYPYKKYLGHQIKKINPQILLLENERVHIVDIYNFGWDTYPDVNVTFAKDGFHPSDEGYNNWTNAFLSRIQD